MIPEKLIIVNNKNVSLIFEKETFISFELKKNIFPNLDKTGTLVADVGKEG